MKTNKRCLGFLLLLAWLGGAACAPAVCHLRGTAMLPLPAPNDGPQAITTQQWMMLLLRGPHHTCVGEPIALASEGIAPQATLLPEPQHVIFANAGGNGVHVVWLQTHQDKDHMYGPLAVVRQTKQQIRVDALGHLAMRPGRLQMSMAPMGAQSAVWAVSEQCHLDAASKRRLCAKQLRILPRVGSALLPWTTAPEVALMRQEVKALGGGWFRMMDYSAECDVQNDVLLVQEQLQSKEVFLRKAQVPARKSRQMQGRRTLTLCAPNMWQVSGPTLWDQATRGQKQ